MSQHYYLTQCVFIMCNDRAWISRSTHNSFYFIWHYITNATFAILEQNIPPKVWWITYSWWLSVTLMSIYLEYNPCCDFKLGSRLKWVMHFGGAVLLRRHVSWSPAVPNCPLNYCEICSGAYVYVMITNWFQLHLNATIQLPSGPSVSVFGVCVCEEERVIE